MLNSENIKAAFRKTEYTLLLHSTASLMINVPWHFFAVEF